MVYPNGRDVQYGYGTANAIDDIMSRLETITDNDGTSVAYKYLGTGQIVEEDYVTSQTKLSYLAGSDNVTGLDRFGRIEDQIWTDYGADPDAVIDHYPYTYDRAGNRIEPRQRAERRPGRDLRVRRPRPADRVGPRRCPQKEWTLDSLGNDLDAGDYNAANEETPTVGSAVLRRRRQHDPLQSGDTAVYDAWNRMVEVDDASRHLAAKRVRRHEPADSDLQRFRRRHARRRCKNDYYSGQQVTLSYTFDGDSNFQGGQAYIWSPRYIDSPILRDTYTAGTTSSNRRPRLLPRRRQLQRHRPCEANRNESGPLASRRALHLHALRLRHLS